MSQEALKCFKFFCFDRVKGLLGVAAPFCWGAARPPAHPAVHQDLQTRRGQACHLPASLPLLISLSCPANERARESAPCTRVRESRAPLLPLNVNWSQQKEQPYFERREWTQTDFQMSCWHWLSKESGMLYAGERLVFALQGEVSDLGRTLTLSIFHLQGKGSAQGNAVSFMDAYPCSVFQRRT